MVPTRDSVVVARKGGRMEEETMACVPAVVTREGEGEIQLARGGRKTERVSVGPLVGGNGDVRVGFSALVGGLQRGGVWGGS